MSQTIRQSPPAQCQSFGIVSDSIAWLIGDVNRPFGDAAQCANALSFWQRKLVSHRRMKKLARRNPRRLENPELPFIRVSKLVASGGYVVFASRRGRRRAFSQNGHPILEAAAYPLLR
jgi:hypothetical protein